MSNRFHNKFHRHNHHTYSSADADSSHDSIASSVDPFQGDFIVHGALSASAPTSAYAGIFQSNNIALCAIGGIYGIRTNSMLASSIYGTTISGANILATAISASNLNLTGFNAVYSVVTPTSANWNSVYSSVNATSANWNGAYSSVSPSSGNWNSTYASVAPVSSNWNSVYNSVNPISANWNSTYSSVNANSGTWNINSSGNAYAVAAYSALTATSGNWNSVYNTVTTTSGNWNSVYNSVVTTSGNWNLAYYNVNLYSSNWNSVYSSMAAASAGYDSVVTNVNNNSSNWNSTYTTVYQNSGNWSAPRNRPYYSAQAASSVNLFSPVQFTSAFVTGMPGWAEYTDRGTIYYDGNYNSTYQTHGAANRHCGSVWFKIQVYVTNVSWYPIPVYLFRVDDQFYMYSNGNYATPIMKWTSVFSRSATQAPITSSISLSAGLNTIEIVTNNSLGGTWGLDMGCPMLNPAYALWIDPQPGY